MWSLNLLRSTIACVVVALVSASDGLCFNADNQQQQQQQQHNNNNNGHICSIEDNATFLPEDAGDINCAKDTYVNIMTVETYSGYATTVTQIIYVDQPQGTPAISSYTTASLNKQQDKGMDTTDSRNRINTSIWSLVFRPLRIVNAIVALLFSYVAVPTWLVGCWIARVLLFKPAVFIYLLFLEKPFKAIVSVFLWILPLLAFVIATTITGTIIGGTLGWISALSSRLFQHSTNALLTNNEPERRPLDDATAPEARVSLGNIPDGHLIDHEHNDMSSRAQDATTDLGELSPGPWTRRRISGKRQL